MIDILILPDTPTFLVFITASLALYLSPGPDMIYIASRAIGQGRKAGFCSALGVTFGLAIHMLAAVLGLSAVIVAWPLAIMLIKWSGALYLIYLGIRILMDKTEPNFEAGNAVAADSAWSIFRQGVVTNLLNPKIALFFMAFLPQFVDPGAGAIWPQMLTLGGVFSIGGLVWVLVLAYAFGGLGNWIGARRNFWRWQRRFTGGSLITLAVYLVASDPP